MATVNSTARELQSSATQTAGGGDTTGSEQTVGTTFGGTATITITNGATGPTIGCTVKLQVREDSTGTWRNFFEKTAGVVNSGVYTWNPTIPPGFYGIRTVFGGNTGQNVTIECQFNEITSIA